jgi:hypothetical protein
VRVPPLFKGTPRAVPDTNLNNGCLLEWVPFPVLISNGVWSEISLFTARTVVRGNFSSHSVEIKIRSMHYGNTDGNVKTVNIQKMIRCSHCNHGR